jgi:hypothetical protein
MKFKETVISKGFASEIDWQNDIRFSDVTEHDFLRETAWVTLSSGMREAVVRSRFPAISAAFYSWRSAAQIVRNSEQCKECALAVFHHRPKINAIISVAQCVVTAGFERFKKHIEQGGVDFIRRLPFMGPATSYHLAKNIGLDVVKPDRHLLRVATAAGYESPRRLCEHIAESVGDRLSVVDLVIWRFATLNPSYEEYFI